MAPAPVPIQACFCNDSQQKPGSDTTKYGSLTRGAYIHSWAAQFRGVKSSKPSASVLCSSVSRKTRNVIYKEIL